MSLTLFGFHLAPGAETRLIRVAFLYSEEIDNASKSSVARICFAGARSSFRLRRRLCFLHGSRSTASACLRIRSSGIGPRTRLCLGEWIFGLAWRTLGHGAGLLGTAAQTARSVGRALVSAVWARVSILSGTVEIGYDC